MKLFVGLDVSLEKTSACVVSEHGRIVREAEVASDPDALAAFAKDQPGDDASLVPARSTWNPEVTLTPIASAARVGLGHAWVQTIR